MTGVSRPRSEEQRRQALLQQKLPVLARARWDAGDAAPVPFPGGAALRDGRRGWVLVEAAERAVGPALAWAVGAGVDELHLVGQTGVGTAARRAAAFRTPPGVWSLAGAELSPAVPQPLPPEPALPAAVADLAAVITGAGAEAVAEHGMLLGEVLGLEVARVRTVDHGAVLEVGVGRFDRDARQTLYAGLPGAPDPADDLARVVADVRRRRVEGVPAHPANRLSPERWLRSVVVQRPELVGARRLVPSAPPLPRRDLLMRSPAPAVGTDGDGRPVVVVCSAGVDPDLVPTAVDARLAWEPGPRTPPRLVVVVPDGDDHPVTRRLAAALTEPAEVRTVPRHWRALAA